MQLIGATPVQRSPPSTVQRPSSLPQSARGARVAMTRLPVRCDSSRTRTQHTKHTSHIALTCITDPHRAGSSAPGDVLCSCALWSSRSIHRSTSSRLALNGSRHEAARPMSPHGTNLSCNGARRVRPVIGFMSAEGSVCSSRRCTIAARRPADQNEPLTSFSRCSCSRLRLSSLRWVAITSARFAASCSCRCCRQASESGGGIAA